MVEFLYLIIITCYFFVWGKNKWIDWDQLNLFYLIEYFVFKAESFLFKGHFFVDG